MRVDTLRPMLTFGRSLTAQAFKHNGGYPKDEEVFQQQPKNVIHYGDIEDLGSGDLAGAGLNITGCGGSVRNVCKEGLPDLVRATQEVLHKRMARLADKFGKSLCNRAEILIQFEAVGAEHPRIYALLAKAIFSPKMQVWCYCAASEDAGTGLVVLPPYEVKILSADGLIGKTSRRVYFVTSDELSLRMAQMHDKWRASQLIYEMPPTDHLLTMLVQDCVELPDFEEPVPRNSVAPNVALRDLKSLHNSRNAGEVRAIGRGRGHHSASRGGRDSYESGSREQHARADSLEGLWLDIPVFQLVAFLQAGQRS